MVYVTSIVERFQLPFDSNFWSAYKALELLLDKDLFSIEKKSLLNTKVFDKRILDVYSITELDFNKVLQLILDNWDLKSRESQERGLLEHEKIEKLFSDKVDLSFFNVNFNLDYIKNQEELLDGVYIEYPIQYKYNDLLIKGRIDLLIKKGNDIYIVDHKFVDNIKFKSGYDVKNKSNAKMLYPLNLYDDCDFNHYQLLLSIYAYILLKLNSDFNIKQLMINHNNEKVYNCDYIKSDIDLMLKFYYKEYKKEIQRNKRKPIEY